MGAIPMGFRLVQGLAILALRLEFSSVVRGTVIENCIK
jgi:hypothetical protein